MKLTITCQLCGKVLSVAEKDAFTDDDINMYEQNSSCDTIQSQSVDGDGNLVIVYDGQADIQATKTVS